METDRLILRQWKHSDLLLYSRLNADPKVMRFFPSIITEAESDAQAKRIHALIETNGWGFWAVEVKASQQFIGFVGLHRQDQDSGLPEAPLVEIGWRLGSDAWGKGYATEAARAVLHFAFDVLKLPCIYSFTAISNLPSQRVMQRIGLTSLDQTFLHPKLAADHPLAPHCLYRITRLEYFRLEKN